MSTLVKNAAPHVYMLGTQDNSIRMPLLDNASYPQHLPLFFIFAKKGPAKRLYGSIATLQNIFHADTFRSDKPYFNHATMFLNNIAATGNGIVVERVIPEDAGVRANVTLWIDVLETEVPNYKRTSEGEYLVDDETNSYVVDNNRPTIQGYRVKWITSTDPVKEEKLGSKKPIPGTMKDNGRTSTMYPVFELRAKYQGEYYNNIGFSISSLTGNDQDFKSAAYNKSLNYKLTLFTRKDSKSNPDVLRTLYDEPGVNVSLTSLAVDPNTDKQYDIETIFNSEWFNETDSLLPVRYKDYESLYFYRDVFKKVCTAMVEKEREFVTTDDVVWGDGVTAPTMSWYDFTTDDKDLILEEGFMLNPFNCKTSKGVKYFTVLPSNLPSYFGEGQKEVVINPNIPIFLESGSDGSITNEEFEKLVDKRLDKYADANSDAHDLAVNPESIFYDSGFTLEAKKQLTRFILLRKDTILILSTHDCSLKHEFKSLSDSRAIGIALKNRLKLCPESEEFGTPCARGAIVLGSGLSRDDTSNNRYPLSLSLAIKSARMMGASNGTWNMTYMFDTQPNNIITEMVDIEPKNIPAGVKPTLWNDGLIWAMPNSDNEFYFPALQTVYTNDTSTLNSYFAIMVISKCTKLAAQIHREFTGDMKSSPEAFLAKINARAAQLVNGLFGSVVTVIPDAYMDNTDITLGYSWHFRFKIYGQNMKTAMVYYTAAYRASDLTNGN